VFEFIAGGDFYWGVAIPELVKDGNYFSLILFISCRACTNIGTKLFAFIVFYF
jgi:hypothetical protein